MNIWLTFMTWVHNLAGLMFDIRHLRFELFQFARYGLPYPSLIARQERSELNFPNRRWISLNRSLLTIVVADRGPRDVTCLASTGHRRILALQPQVRLWLTSWLDCPLFARLCFALESQSYHKYRLLQMTDLPLWPFPQRHWPGCSCDVSEFYRTSSSHIEKMYLSLDVVPPLIEIKAQHSLNIIRLVRSEFMAKKGQHNDMRASGGKGCDVNGCAALPVDAHSFNKFKPPWREIFDDSGGLRNRL